MVRSEKASHLALGTLAAAAIGATIYLSVGTEPTAPIMGVQTAATPVRHAVVATEYERPVYDLEPRTLNELLRLPADQLHRVDIARTNLLCASGLPSTADLHIDHAMATLDEWAERVAFETDRHLYRVTDPRFADRYQGSEAHFRAEMLAQVLQEDLGVKFDSKAVGNFSFASASVAFLHGMIPAPGSSVEETSGGTCVSMPVLYVAVGRRLGYPLNLVTTDSHVFARWNGEAFGGHENPAWRETFNCETTNGFEKLDDAYYTTWPRPVSPRDIAANGYLESLNPAEELAQFLAARGHHALDVGQTRFAARCYENAYLYDTRRRAYRSWFQDAAIQSGYRPVSPELHRLVTAASVYEPPMHLRSNRIDVVAPTAASLMPQPLSSTFGPARRDSASPVSGTHSQLFNAPK